MAKQTGKRKAAKKSSSAKPKASSEELLKYYKDMLLIRRFEEKPQGDGNWINGGYFVLSPKVIDLIEGDSTVWEKAPLESLAQKGELSAFRHDGFWQPVDTLRDKNMLQDLWETGEAPWKVWL